MVSWGSLRRLIPLGAAAWLLAISAGAVLAEDPVNCSVSVDPLAASGGSVFVFSGTSYKPTQLILQKEGEGPITHDLDVGDADPWEVTVRSRVGDEGTWTATFVDEAANCTASIDFRVTLSNTDVFDDIAATASQAPAPVLLYLAVVVLGFGGGVLIGRRMHARVQH